jgi:hypothetical protein
MKGIELPINVLIIIALAIIVLIAVIMMFYGTFNNGSSVMTSDMAKTNACQVLSDKGCTAQTNTITIPDFDADRDGIVGITDATSGWDWDNMNPSGSGCMNKDLPTSSGDNLASLCACFYSIDTEDKCKSVCGCR